MDINRGGSLSRRHFADSSLDLTNDLVIPSKDIGVLLELN